MASVSEPVSATGVCCVLLNDVADDATLPFDLGGWTLDRPTDAELQLFRPQLVALNEMAGLHSGLVHEATIETHDPDGWFVGFAWDRQPSDWRYAVVRLDGGDPDERHLVDEALRISPADLRVAGVVTYDAKIVPSPHVGLDISVWAESMRQFVGRSVPQTPDFARVKEILELRRNLDEGEYPNIARALKLFKQFDRLSDLSDAKLLGQFAVLESLLSHDPGKNDPVDSITRQLKRNLVLLDHRMPPNENLGLTEFAKGTQSVSAEQVIGRLYSIRSAVAHGGDPSEHVTWLNDRRPASWTPLADHEYLYVRKMTQRILVAALQEPQLVTDLRGTA